MPAIRTALDYAENEFQIKRLLLSDELRAAAGRVFLDHLGKLIDLGRSGQLFIYGSLEAHLERIDRDTLETPHRLFPVVTARGLHGPKIVVIDPKVAFGRPFIAGKGVRTATIVERLDAEESREAVAADYGLEPDEIDEAIFYERAA